MPNTHETLEDLFTDCANAIMEKDGTSFPIVADLFPERIRAIPQGGGDITVEPLPVSANGTYTAPSGKAYSPVVVNVPQGVFPSGTKNITENNTYDVTNFASVAVNVPSSGVPLPSPIAAGNTPVLCNASAYESQTTDYEDTGIHLTIKKAGTYKFKWVLIGNRNGLGSDLTAYSKLYVNGSEQGSEQSQSGTSAKICEQILSVQPGDVVSIWIKIKSTTYVAKAALLTACINWDNTF